MIDLRTPVLNLAKALMFMREVNGSNRSELIDEMIRRTSLDPTQRLPWCAAFVAWVGYAALGKQWPLKRVAGCMSLYNDARGKGLVGTVPVPGAIFLLWGTGHDGITRFKHTGFVVEKGESAVWTTREGNTNLAGSAEGDRAFERKREFKTEDRFIYWWDGVE